MTGFQISYDYNMDILFILLALPQRQGYHNSISQLLWAYIYLTHPVNLPSLS